MPGRRQHDPKPVWRDPDEFLRWDFLPKVLDQVPIGAAMADTLRRPAFLSWCYALLEWTNERLNPSWKESAADRRDRRKSELLEWRRRVMWFLAKAALLLPAAEVHERILTPIFQHDDETAASLICPFVNGVAAAGIADPLEINPNALDFIDACMTRILRDRMWERARNDDGDIYGYNIPDIVRVFLFIAVENAPAAARFANRDWRDIAQVLPIIDRFVRAVGDIPDVMGSFLTLCERSLANYPAEAFVDQIRTALSLQDGIPLGWRGTTIAARIAALVHAFAEKSVPLPPSLAQAMLRILDRLVDMGDRRSAALQTSEVFKEVRF